MDFVQPIGRGADTIDVMNERASARSLPPLPPLVDNHRAPAKRARFPMAEFWITDIGYGPDGRIERYGMIPAPVWAQYLSGRAAQATVFVRPEHVDEMIEAGIQIFTTRKSRDGRTVARGPSLDAGRS